MLGVKIIDEFYIFLIHKLWFDYRGIYDFIGSLGTSLNEKLLAALEDLFFGLLLP